MATTPELQHSRPALSGANTQPSTRQLDFYQAMHDFKHMFPEMDEDVIEAVLRANGGAVDATIDQLLTMNMDTEDQGGYQKTQVNMTGPGRISENTGKYDRTSADIRKHR